MALVRNCTQAVAGGLLALAAAAVAAQVPPPKPPETGVSERARREADRVLEWIRLHGDRPRRRAGKNGADAQKPAEPKAAATTGERLGVAGPAAQPASGPASGPVPGAGRADAGGPLVPDSALAAQELAPAGAAQPGGRAASAPAAEPADAVSNLTLIRLTWVAPVDPPGRVGEPAHPMPPDLELAGPQLPHKGLARLRFTVQPDGTVSDAQVVHSTDQLAHAAVLAAVSQWHFPPLGRARAAIVDLGFGLEDPERTQGP